MAVLVLAAACGDNADPSPPVAGIEVVNVLATPPTQLDLLIQLDNSNGGPEQQEVLARAMDAFVTALRPTTSLHVGVATSDLGDSSAEMPGAPSGDPPGCVGEGDGGHFQNHGVAHDVPYLVDEGATRNFDGDLIAAVRANLHVGSTGCGFEQPLAATRRALDPAVNPGFRRSDAALAVLLMMDEDDCSFLDPQFLVDDNATLGLRQSFRCTRFGIRCDEELTEVGTKTNCRPDEASPYLEPVAVSIDALRAQATDVVVAAITGPREPFAVELRPPPGSAVPAPALGHACTYLSSNGLSAVDPNVRVRSLVDAFASRGSWSTRCTDDDEPGVRAFARSINAALGTVCLDAAQLTGHCEVHDLLSDGTVVPVAQCPLADDCYEIAPDGASCPDARFPQHFVMHRAAAPPSGARTVMTCTPAGV